MDRVKRIWCLSPIRAAKVQASMRIRAVSPEPLLLAHTSSESRGTFRQKTRSLAPLNGRACAVKICHDGMFEDTNSLDGAHMMIRHTAGAKNLYMYNHSTTVQLLHSGKMLILRSCVVNKTLVRLEALTVYRKFIILWLMERTRGTLFFPVTLALNVL